MSETITEILRRIFGKALIESRRKEEMYKREFENLRKERINLPYRNWRNTNER